MLDSANAANPLQIYSSTVLQRQTGLSVTTAVKTGVAADLYDSAGNLLAARDGILDLRTLPAGTYYIRVYNPAAAQTGLLAFRL